MDHEEAADTTYDLADAPRQLPVLVTTVDIGEDQSDRIELHEGDSPEDAAAAFCAKHGLPDEVCGPLAAHIADNLAHALLPTPADTPSRSDAGGSDSSGNDAILGRPEPADVLKPTLQQPGLRDSLFSEEGSFVAEPLPAAAARPAEGLAYTAPSSPVKRAAVGIGAGGRRAPAAAGQDAAQRAVLPGPVEDSERLWGGGVGFARGRAQQTRHATERLYGLGRLREQKLQAERRLRDEAAKTMRSSYALAISAKSRQLAAGRTAGGGYANHGERMYVEGVLEQRRKEQATEDATAARAAAELEGLTLKPRISAMARNLRCSGDRDRLARPRTDKTQERLAELAREKEEAAVADCTFRPAINRRSDRLMADRSIVLREHRISAHDQLYQDAGRRAARATEYECWYPEEVTFHPAVNPPRRASRGAPPRGGDDEPVQERLYAVARKTADKLEARRSAAPVDPATGRPLFTPATGRAPMQPRNSAGAPVGEYLYGISQEHADKKEVLQALTSQQQQQDATATYTTSTSKALVGKLKAKRFRQIFDYLDTTGTGDLDLVTLVFGGDKALVDTLDAEVRADVEAAARLLSKRVAVSAAPAQENAPPAGADEAADDSPLTVSLPGFAGLMEEVLARSHHPRAYLLPSQHTRKKWEEPTFKPAMNPRSLALAQRRRPPGQTSFDVLHGTAAAAESRRDERRQAAAAAEMQECTFKPALAPPRRRSTSAGTTKGPVPSTPASQEQGAGNGAAATPAAATDVTPAAPPPCSKGPQRPATGQRSAAITRASAAPLHRSLDHAKYTSLEAQVRAAMEETAALTGLPAVELGRAPVPLASLAT